MTREIAAALQTEVEEVGAEHAVFVIEEYAERPLTDMPEIILEDLAQSQVSIFCAQSQRGELRSRMQMSDIVNKQRIRHGHMVNITRQIMLEGMRADFREVDALSQRLIERARMTERIKCRTPGGTDYEAEFSPKLKWLKTSGIITPDKWGNLPGGEIFTSPANSNGVFVVDGVVGDYLCQKYGDIQETPLTIEVENNRIRDLQCENRELLEEFRAYTSTDENSNRVGEFAVGTNTACTRRDRQHFAGRKNPRHSHRLWPSLRRTHRPELDFQNPHRLRRPRLRHLVRRREGDGAREVFGVVLHRDDR